MEIERLDLIRWGKFAGHTIRLQSGVNIIYGGNESGKSTIHSFLGAMLSGPRPKEEKRRGIFGDGMTEPDGEGAMTVWDGGQRYEICRTFGVYPGMLSVKQEVEEAEEGNEWEAVMEPQEVLSELLGGLDADTFESTVFWTQNQSICELHVEDGLRQCLKAAKTTGNGADGEAALKVLEERRACAQQKKKKESDALEERIHKRQLEAEYVRKEALRLQAQRNALRQGGRREQEEESSWQGDGITDTGKNLIQMLLLLAGVLALLGALLLQHLLLRIFLGIFGGAFLLLFFPVRRFLTGEKEEDESYDLSVREKQLEAEIRKKEDIYQKLQEEVEKLYHQHVKLETADTEITALNLAIDRIMELSEKSGGGPASEIGERASEIIKALSGGQCDRIVVETSGRIRVYFGGQATEQRRISTSMLHQIRFAVRMAAGEVLAGEEELPFLLDEPFAMYDDERLRSVLSWLERCGHQVILFTCQKRVRQIMDEIRKERYAKA